MSKLLQERWARLAGLISEDAKDRMVVDPIPRSAQRSDRDSSLTTEPKGVRARRNKSQTSADHMSQPQRGKTYNDSDSKPSFSGDVTRISGSPAQYKVVEFWTQLGNHFNAESNATSSHEADVQLQIKWTQSMQAAYESGLSADQQNAFTRVQFPNLMQAMRFPIEVKQGAGEFDGENIQTDKNLFKKKINENAAFAIGHPNGSGVTFCYLDNQKGHLLKMVLALAGNDIYSMVSADDLWAIKVDSDRGTKAKPRLVVQIHHNDLVGVINNVSDPYLKGTQTDLNWQLGVEFTNAAARMRTVSADVSSTIAGVRREQFVKNLNLCGLNTTEDKIESYQNSYNQHGNPLFSIGWNDAQKMGYSNLPTILELRKLPSEYIDDSEAYLDTLYHPDVADQLGDLLLFEFKGRVLVFVPPVDIGPLGEDGKPLDTSVGQMRMKDLRTTTENPTGRPSNSNIGKFRRVLERNILVHVELLTQNLLLQYEKALKEGEYVHASEWREVFGNGAPPTPHEEPIGDIKLNPLEVEDDITQWEEFLNAEIPVDPDEEDALSRADRLESGDFGGILDHRKRKYSLISKLL